MGLTSQFLKDENQMKDIEITRRDFLKKLSAYGGILFVGSSHNSFIRPKKKLSKDAIGVLYDATVCIGCKACVFACKKFNNMPLEHNPLDLSSRTLNIIKTYKFGEATFKDREVNGYSYIQRRCLHCIDPSCVSACPASAMTKDPKTGIVSYNKNACIGCRYCQVACPFNIPKFEWDNPFPEIKKCQMCLHRIKKGQISACCEFCLAGASIFGRVEDLLNEAKRRLRLKPGQKYKYPIVILNSPSISMKVTGKDYNNLFEEAKKKLELDPEHKKEYSVDAKDLSYRLLRVGKYYNHIYGEKEMGGTQVIMLAGVPFSNLGLPNLPERSYASISEGIQHTFYKGLIAPIIAFGCLLYAVYKSTSKEDK